MLGNTRCTYVADFVADKFRRVSVSQHEVWLRLPLISSNIRRKRFEQKALKEKALNWGGRFEWEALREGALKRSFEEKALRREEKLWRKRFEEKSLKKKRWRNRYFRILLRKEPSKSTRQASWADLRQPLGAAKSRETHNFEGFWGSLQAEVFVFFQSVSTKKKKKNDVSARNTFLRRISEVFF